MKIKSFCFVFYLIVVYSDSVEESLVYYILYRELENIFYKGLMG